MRSAPPHCFLEVRVRPEQVELAELRLWELGASGLEERDQTTIDPGPSGGDVVIIAAFDDDEAARRALDRMQTTYDATLSSIPRRDWATEWREGFGAQRIGKRILLHPSWEPVEAAPGDVVITIDPENAFGSGDHETTRLVLTLLDEQIRGGERVLDVGCGSGILSIAAVRLGAASSVAIDIEPEAVEVTRRNAALNGVGSSIEASTRTLSDIDERHDLVLANIETRVLVPMAAPLQEKLAPGAPLILSGILRDERAQLLSAFGSLRLRAEVEEGEWCAFVLVREEAA